MNIDMLSRISDSVDSENDLPQILSDLEQAVLLEAEINKVDFTVKVKSTVEGVRIYANDELVGKIINVESDTPELIPIKGKEDLCSLLCPDWVLFEELKPTTVSFKKESGVPDLRNGYQYNKKYSASMVKEMGHPYFVKQNWNAFSSYLHSAVGDQKLTVREITKFYKDWIKNGN
jgi:hypothetical protein